MMPSAPLLLSTPTIWPVRRWIASPARRAGMSAVPPGAKPTITWIGCLATHSARADGAASSTGLASRLRRNMRNSPNAPTTNVEQGPCRVKAEHTSFLVPELASNFHKALCSTQHRPAAYLHIRKRPSDPVLDASRYLLKSAPITIRRGPGIVD